MTTHLRYLVPALAVSVFIFASGVLPANAQPQAPRAASTKRILQGLAERKPQKGPVTILTPADLSVLSVSELSRVMGGDPCETAAPITIGQTVNGELTGADCQAPDSSYADFYRFQGQANQHITLRLDSAAFDPYLGLAEEFGDFVREDDDGGEGTNSLINVVLPSTGPYIILANSALPNQFGSYTLSVALFVPCSFSVDPGGTTLNVPGVGGTYTFSVVTQPACEWDLSDPPYFSQLSQSSGTGPASITMTIGINDRDATRVGYIKVWGGTNVLTVSQAAIPCNTSISAESIHFPPTGGTGQFNVTVEPNCSWGVLIGGGNPSWILATNLPANPTGNGSLSFQVNPFYGPGTRTGVIVVRNRTFTITQTGMDCTYSISPSVITAPAAGASGVINVTTQPGCYYGMGNNYMIQFPNSGPPPPTGSGQLQYTVLPNPNPGARGIDAWFYAGGLSIIQVPFRQAGTNHKPVADYDGDRSSDVSVRRPSNNNWYLLRGTAGYTAMTWGIEGDLMAPADYDGDSRSDIAVFRPSEGRWYIVMSSTGAFQTFNWGAPGDVPVPADRDGDGRADMTVYRGSNGTWYTRYANGNLGQNQFGTSGDKPLIGDFDWDGRADYAVYRPSDNNWHIVRSWGYTVQTWGEPGDIPVPADYDGDGTADLAVFRPSTGQWYRVKSLTGYDIINWGASGDVPVAADYDADGKADVAVFRPSEGKWYILGSSMGILVRSFGLAGDVPTQSAFIY